jgi:hypothetical protein
MIHPDRLVEPQRLNLYTYARNNPLRYVDPNGLDDITYDQAGNEVERKKHGKLYNFFVGDTWKLNADNGQTYTLDSALKPLQNGQRYQIVSQQETRDMLSGFLKENAYGRGHESAGLGTVLQNSPTNQAWDFKNNVLTENERRNLLFDYSGTGTLNRADYVGNLAWGFIMASYGYPETFAKAGAGGFQTYEAVQGKTGWGSPFSYMDDPRDTEAVGKGYQLWRQSDSNFLGPGFRIGGRGLDWNMRRIGIALVGILTLMGLSGCRSRYFSDEAAAVQFLNAHKQGFEEIAEKWAKTVGAAPTSCFCNFNEGNYRWGKSFVKKSGDGYTVELNAQRLQATSLEQAAQLAGASSSELQHWIELADQYKIYCIQPGADGAVQILLAGSDWSPYGFRYAPAGNEHSESALRYYAQHGGVDNSDRKMEPVGDRWFYFEAKR